MNLIQTEQQWQDAVRHAKQYAEHMKTRKRSGCIMLPAGTL